MTSIIRAVVATLLSIHDVWPQGPAQIFVYAQREGALRSAQPVWCDGTLVARLKRGTFFAINVAPGRHVFQETGGVPAFVDVKAGNQSFLRAGLHAEINQPSVLVFDSVHPDVAGKELRFLAYIDAKAVFSASVAKVDPRPHPEPQLKTRNDKQ